MVAWGNCACNSIFESRGSFLKHAIIGRVYFFLPGHFLQRLPCLKLLQQFFFLSMPQAVIGQSPQPVFLLIAGVLNFSDADKFMVTKLTAAIGHALP
jgi:hypothetical protein